MKRGKKQPGEVEVVERQADAASQADASAEPEADSAEAGDEQGGEMSDAQAAQPSELESLQARVASLEDNLLRAKADYQNLQRRTTIERGEAVRYANAELMRSLLGVLDDFERALQSAESAGNLRAVIDGVRLVYQNLAKSLGEAGLEVIDARLKPFDPAIHEAMMQQPTDEHPPGTVIEQIAPGYKLRDRVLRPAKVIVSKSPE